MKYFDIKRVGNLWVPADPEVEDLARFVQDDQSTMTQIRYYLFAGVEEKMPGIYALDWPIPELRSTAFSRIEQRSGELIQAGFSFEQVIFSLTQEAQIRYTTMMMLADMLPYPLGINSLDDSYCLYLQNGDHTRMFCMAALSYVKLIVDSGTIQKDRVRAMDSADELVRYTDPRPIPEPIPSMPA
jgi:hypothetical protein